MKVSCTSRDLIAFEEEIAACFNDKQIRAPIHLYHGCEEQMINVFRHHVAEDDWVLCSWRSHYQCLLKGVPPEEVKSAILEGKSISLCFPAFRIVSSAIVGGVLPIATGIALGIKQRRESNKVVCFMGEMTSETGIAHECIKYSTNHDLPILFVVEDNDKSVCTPTRDAWNTQTLTYEKDRPANVLYYQYENKWPHAGSGVRINF
jgi:TPP-dependent pyruvate/acetoin dehydrogenase alpha subunit